jgi:hypothetical protein
MIKICPKGRLRTENLCDPFNPCAIRYSTHKIAKTSGHNPLWDSKFGPFLDRQSQAKRSAPEQFSFLILPEGVNEAQIKILFICLLTPKTFWIILATLPKRFGKIEGDRQINDCHA